MAYTVTQKKRLAIIRVVLSLSLIAGSSHAEDAHNNPITVLDNDMCAGLKSAHVMQPKPSIECNRLRLIKVRYLGFDNSVHEDGTMMVLDVVAPHVADAFLELFKYKIRINKINLMNNYNGDDEASMADNNTSSFNDRDIANGNHLSLHAYGLAIDVNPVQNPYLKQDGRVINVSPKAGLGYINRSELRPLKKSRQGMAETMIDVFANHGFSIWGGYWDDPIDYQHFQVSPKMADTIIKTPYEEASVKFNNYIQHYRQCLKQKEDHPQNHSRKRQQCIEDTEKEI